MPGAPTQQSFFMRLATAVLVALASSVVFTAARTGATDEVRALWVTRATLTSPDSIAQMVRSAQAGGFNTILVQVRGRGDAYYEGGIEPRASDLAARPGFDPLAETLAHAHAVGIRVHAWIVSNLVSSAVELPASRDHLLYRQPEWLMVPHEIAAEMLAIDPRSPEYVGKLARWTRGHPNEIEGLYVSPVHAATAKHLAEVVGDIARRYEVDGIHLDYLRYPNDSFDYSRAALQQFKQTVAPQLPATERAAANRREAIDPLAYPQLFSDRWAAFRRARLTAMLMRARTAVKTARPSAIFSVAVTPDVADAHDLRLQDWRTWVDQSLVDVLCPMAYTKDLSVFETQIADAQALAAGIPVWAGVGAYRLSQPDTLRQIAAARRLRTAGVILFSYEALTTPPNSMATFSQLTRAAFGTGSF